MAAFCRYWRMTPRDVDQLSDAEWFAMIRFMRDEARQAERARRKRAR